MGGRAQVALWIVIGIVLLAAAAILTPLLTPTTTQVDFLPVQNYVQDCLEQSAKEGILLQAIQGGHIILPDTTADTTQGPVAYAVRERYSALPSLDEMQRELEAYLQDALPICTAQLDLPGYDLEQAIPQMQVSVQETNVEVIAEYNLKATLGNQTRTFDNFRVLIPSSLWRAHASMSGIVLKTIQEPQWIDLTFLADLDANAKVLPHNGDYIVALEYDDIIFQSAIKQPVNTPPKIIFDDQITTRKDTLYTRAITVESNHDYSCSDTSALFDTQDCILTMTPRVRGIFEGTIRVTDEFGAATEKTIEVIVQ